MSARTRPTRHTFQTPPLKRKSLLYAGPVMAFQFFSPVQKLVGHKQKLASEIFHACPFGRASIVHTDIEP